MARGVRDKRQSHTSGRGLADDMHLAEGGGVLLCLCWGEVEGSCESGGLFTWREAGLNAPAS